MRITPDELFDMEMEVYKQHCDDYQRGLEVLNGDPFGWLAKPEKPTRWRPSPVPPRKRPGAIRGWSNQRKE